MLWRSLLGSLVVMVPCTCSIADIVCDEMKAFGDDQNRLAQSGTPFPPERFAGWADRLLAAIRDNPRSECAAWARIQASVALSMRSTDPSACDDAIAILIDGFAQTDDVAELAHLGNQAVSYVEELDQRRVLAHQASDKVGTVARGAAISADVMRRLPSWRELVSKAQAGTMQWLTFEQIVPLRTHALNTINDLSARREAALAFSEDLRALREAAGRAGTVVDVEAALGSIRAAIIVDALRSDEVTLAAINTLAEQLGSLEPQTEIDDLLAQAKARHGGGDEVLSRGVVLRRMSESISVFGPSDTRVRNLSALSARCAQVLRAGTPDDTLTQDLLNASQDAALDAARALEDTDAGSAADAETRAKRRETLKALLFQRWSRDGQPKAIAQEFVRRFPEDTQHPLVRAAAK